MTNFKFGDVVLVDFPQSGMAQKKKRPALVVLDTGDSDSVLAPITTRKRFAQGDYKLIDWSTSGLLRESWVRLAKIASMEKSDINRRIGCLTDVDKEAVAALWQLLYSFSSENHEINRV